MGVFWVPEHDQITVSKKRSEPRSGRNSGLSSTKCFNTSFQLELLSKHLGKKKAHTSNKQYYNLAMILPKKDLLYHSLHLKWSASLPIKLRGEVALVTETGRLASVNITFTRLGSSALFYMTIMGIFVLGLFCCFCLFDLVFLGGWFCLLFKQTRGILFLS